MTNHNAFELSYVQRIILKINDYQNKVRFYLADKKAAKSNSVMII